MFKPYSNPKEFEAPVAPQEPWRKVLLDAAELIRTKGHCKRALSNEAGNHCMVGALNFIASGDPRTSRGCVGAFSALQRHLYAIVPNYEDSFDGMPNRWNNAPERTAEEVIAALEGAARS